MQASLLQLTGELKELSPQLRIKANVVHAGHLLPQLPMSHIKFNLKVNPLKLIYLNNNQLIAQVLNLMEILAAMEVMELELFNILKILDKLLVPAILMQLLLTHARPLEETIISMELLKLQAAHKFKKLFKEDQWQLELMLLTGISTNQVFSITVILISITLSFQLEAVSKHGLSRTHGLPLGENKDILDLKKEILVLFAKDLHSLFDQTYHIHLLIYFIV